MGNEGEAGQHPGYETNDGSNMRGEVKRNIKERLSPRKPLLLSTRTHVWMISNGIKAYDLGFAKRIAGMFACETAESSASDRRPLKKVASAGTIYFYSAASAQIPLG
jgi:hypothetical protein